MILCLQIRWRRVDFNGASAVKILPGAGIWTGELPTQIPTLILQAFHPYRISPFSWLHMVRHCNNIYSGHTNASGILSRFEWYEETRVAKFINHNLILIRRTRQSKSCTIGSWLIWARTKAGTKPWLGFEPRSGRRRLQRLPGHLPPYPGLYFQKICWVTFFAYLRVFAMRLQ